MIISIIAAMGENRELGKDNKLLWHISDDLKNFKRITLNKPVIMGRKTYESIGRPLPKRTNIIVTRNSSYQSDGILVASNIDEALQMAKESGAAEVMICGGGEIYKLALPVASKMYLSYISGSYEADTFFPDFDKSQWQEAHKVAHNGWYFVELTRIHR